MSVWLRRDRLTNIAFRLVRSTASLPASRTASACTWSKARATWPISSEVSTSIGATWRSATASGVSLSRLIRSGSCEVAMSSAAARSRRSGTASDLATRSAAISTIEQDDNDADRDEQRGFPGAAVQRLRAGDRVLSEAQLDGLHAIELLLRRPRTTPSGPGPR